MAETSCGSGRKKAKVDSSSSPKHDGARRFKSKFQLTWSKKWPCIIAVAHSSSGFRCTACDKVCSCAHQGESDVTRHIQSEKHQKNVQARTNAVPLSSFGFISNSDPLKDKVRHKHRAVVTVYLILYQCVVFKKICFASSTL